MKINTIVGGGLSDGTSPWNRFSLRVPSYGSMDPSPKANYPGIRVLQNDSTVEKNNWTRSYFSRIRRKFTLGSGSRIRFVLDKLLRIQSDRYY